MSFANANARMHSKSLSRLGHINHPEHKVTATNSQAFGC